jgi:hypothetical protein
MYCPLRIKTLISTVLLENEREEIEIIDLVYGEDRVLREDQQQPQQQQQQQQQPKSVRVTLVNIVIDFRSNSMMPLPQCSKSSQISIQTCFPFTVQV